MFSFADPLSSSLNIRDYGLSLVVFVSGRLQMDNIKDVSQTDGLGIFVACLIIIT